jgi:hypothetical protein
MHIINKPPKTRGFFSFLLFPSGEIVPAFLIIFRGVKEYANRYAYRDMATMTVTIGAGTLLVGTVGYVVVKHHPTPSLNTRLLHKIPTTVTHPETADTQ